MRILIADDEFTSRAVLTGILQESGYDTLESEDGLAAWGVLQQPGAPELVILDWMMPQMDGLDVLRHLRGVPADRPPYVIMVTDKSEMDSVVTALNAGANDYICKPFDAGELRARVGVGVRMIEVQAMLATKLAELQDALDQIKTLHGLLHVCANCKRIKDEEGTWKQMEVYVRDRTEAEFSHGLCPKCIEQLYPELYPGTQDQLIGESFNAQ
jgi:DNA-binding response OmpR family regulator